MGTLLWDNGTPEEGAGSNNLTGFLTADDFTLTRGVVLEGLRFWAVGGTQTTGGQLPDFFSGTISWGFYSDNAGKVGDLITTGSDSSPSVLGTGVFDGFGGEIHQLDASLGSVELPAGDYWIALHEGSWGSFADGTSIWWQKSTTQQGEFLQTSTNPIDPDFSHFSGAVYDRDTAFQLSGVVIPEPSTSVLSVIGLLAMSMTFCRSSLLLMPIRTSY